MQHAVEARAANESDSGIVALLRPHRAVLWVVGGLAFFVLNGAFLYYAAFRPDVLAEAMSNPVSLVFMVEAFVMVALFAWMISKAGFRRPGWPTFVVLSIVGSLAFSIPAFLLLRIRKRAPRT